MTRRASPRVRGLYQLKDKTAFVHLEDALLWTDEERRARLTANARRSLESAVRKLDAAGLVGWVVPAPSSDTAH